VTIPTYEEAKERVESGKADPLDIFIVENEPAGIKQEEKFRKELQELVDYIEACL
jgi:predicted glycosyltransferase